MNAEPLVAAVATETIEFLRWVLPYAAAFLALMHLLGPVVVLLRHSIPALYTFEPAPAGPAPESHLHELSSIGFSPVGTASNTQGVVQTDVWLLHREGDPCSASVTCLRSPNQVIRYVEFSQEFTDTPALSVHNSNVSSPFPNDKTAQTVLRYPAMSVDRLYTVFRGVRARSGTPVQTSVSGHELLSQQANAHATRLVARGYYRRHTTDGRRGLTPKGAVVLAWRSLWPWRQVISQLAARRAARVLRTIDA